MMHNLLAMQISILPFLCMSIDMLFWNWQMLEKHFKCFNDKQMKVNPDECHFICSSNVKTSIMVENVQIRNSSCEKRLRVSF